MIFKSVCENLNILNLQLFIDFISNFEFKMILPSGPFKNDAMTSFLKGPFLPLNILKFPQVVDRFRGSEQFRDELGGPVFISLWDGGPEKI